MNPTSEDIKDMLESESSLDLAFSDNLFIGREPATPNNCVTIFDTGGREPSTSMDGANYRYSSIQVRVRNTRYLDAWNMIEAIYDFLHMKSHETWNSIFYSLILAMSDAAFLDWDENNRVRLVQNFEVQRI
jgi:hypothetical protein